MSNQMDWQAQQAANRRELRDRGGNSYRYLDSRNVVTFSTRAEARRTLAALNAISGYRAAYGFRICKRVTDNG